MLWSCEACVEELQNCTEWIWWMLVTLFVFFFDTKIEQGELPGRLLHLLRPAAGEGSLWQSSEVAPSGQRRWWDAWYGAKIYAAIQHHSTSFNIIQAFLYHFTDVSMFREELSMWLSWTLKTLLDFESEISRFEDAKMDQCDQRGCASFCEDMWNVGQVTVGSPTGLLSYCSLIPRFLTDSSPIPFWFVCRGLIFALDRRRSSVVVTDTSCHCPWQKKSSQSNGSWRRQQMRSNVKPLPLHSRKREAWKIDGRIV